MLEHVKKLVVSYTFPPLQLEEVVAALDMSPCAQSHMKTVEMATKFYDAMKDSRFPRHSHARGQAVLEAVNSQVLTVAWSEKPTRAAQVTFPALAVLRSEAARSGEAFELMWKRNADGNDLQIVIRKGSFRALSVRAIISLLPGVHREGMVRGAVHHEMLMDLADRRASVDDLHGNGRFENPDFEGLGMGRLLVSIANEVLKEMLPAQSRVYGRAFHAAEDTAWKFGRIDSEELSAMRSRRVEFWENFGVAFASESTNAYVNLAKEDVVFGGTVGDLTVVPAFNAKLVSVFGDAPALRDFRGAMPIAAAELPADLDIDSCL